MDNIHGRSAYSVLLRLEKQTFMTVLSESSLALRGECSYSALGKTLYTRLSNDIILDTISIALAVHSLFISTNIL